MWHPAAMISACFAYSARRWEVARRTLAVIELRPPNKRLPPFDQAMLGDVLLTSADGAPH